MRKSSSERKSVKDAMEGKRFQRCSKIVREKLSHETTKKKK